MTDIEHDVASDHALVAQATSGDAGAFEALHRRHGDMAWRFAVAITGEAAMAATAVTAAYGTVFTRLRAGRTTADETFRPLLLAAVRNASIDLRRVSAVDAADLPLERSVLTEAYTRLPERWRSVLWLGTVEGMDATAMAPIVGLSADAVTQLGERARHGLHEQFLHAHLAQTGDRNCARAAARLGAHAEGTLDDDDREKLDRHLRLCEACAERRRQLAELGSHLAALAVPAPAALADDARSAWTAALAAPRPRTATGLSATTEKVLAGASAIVAAAGVVGAALLGDGTARTASDSAAPVAPIAADDDTPTTVDLDRGLDIPAVGSRTDVGSVTGPATSASGSSGASGRVLGASAPSSTAAPAGDLGSDPTPPAPSAPAQPRTAPPANPPATGPDADAPALSAGTTIADVPVAVEVGTSPGVTVGDVSIGSEPQPSDEPLQVDGPLAPVADGIDEVTGALGL
jgi:DNA-directed RNA polymerase specialized sigma24 family protein